MKKPQTTVIPLLLALVLPTPALAENGVTSDTILFGQSVNLTGASPAANGAFRDGFDTYIEGVNKAGGIYGRKIKVLREDDGFEPARAVKNTEKFIRENKVFALYGYNGAPLAKAVLPLVHSEDIPFIAPFSGAEFLRSPVNKNIFNFRADAGAESEALVKYATEKLGAKSVGIFYQDDAFGNAGRSSVEKAMFRRGLTVKGVFPYRRNDLNIKEAVKEMKRSGVKAVITWATFLPAALMIQTSKELGFKPIFLCSSNVGSAGFIEAGKDALEGTYVNFVVPPPGSENLPIVRNFEHEMKNSPRPVIDAFSEEGYINGAIIVHALKKAGPNLTRDAFRQALESMHDERIDGLEVALSPQNHQSTSQVFLAQVKNGKFVSLQKKSKARH